MSVSSVVVLASTSKYRRELLTRLGITFDSVAPDYDEKAAMKALGACSAEDLAYRLARGKVHSLSSRYPDKIVIGSDQLVALDDVVLGKPMTEERALEQLDWLQGREHRLITAVVAKRGDQEEHCVSVHTMKMRSWSREALWRYIEKDRPLDCAGAYKVESLGVALFESMNGADFTGIIGLPLTGVVELLLRFGVSPL